MTTASPNTTTHAQQMRFNTLIVFVANRYVSAIFTRYIICQAVENTAYYVYLSRNGTRRDILWEIAKTN